MDDAHAGRRRARARQARPRALAARLGVLGPAGPLSLLDTHGPATSRRALRLLLLAARWRCCRWPGCGCASARASARARLAALTALTLFLTFDLIVFGAFTRLTDSGLGCPDWPGCYGDASPIGAAADIHAAQSALPSGPVTFSKAWIEMIHRYLAMTVGALILVMALASWVWRRGCRSRPGGRR